MCTCYAPAGFCRVYGLPLGSCMPVETSPDVDVPLQPDELTQRPPFEHLVQAQCMHHLFVQLQVLRCLQHFPITVMPLFQDELASANGYPYACCSLQVQTFYIIRVPDRQRRMLYRRMLPLHYADASPFLSRCHEAPCQA